MIQTAILPADSGLAHTFVAADTMADALKIQRWISFIGHNTDIKDMNHTPSWIGVEATYLHWILRLVDQSSTTHLPCLVLRRCE